MIEIEPDLAENYRRLRSERGLSWEQLASQQGPQSPRLAAWMREQDAADNTGRRDQSPRGRTRNAPSEIA